MHLSIIFPKRDRKKHLGLPLQEDYNKFFGAVALFPVAQFERVNGFFNNYWGRGFEDVDLRNPHHPSE